MILILTVIRAFQSVLGVTCLPTAQYPMAAMTPRCFLFTHLYMKIIAVELTRELTR